jgi:hypothetical protein
MTRRKEAMMRTRPWFLIPGREEEVVLQRKVSPEPRRKKDLSKVKCFACHEFGHYALQFPQHQ